MAGTPRLARLIIPRRIALASVRARVGQRRCRSQSARARRRSGAFVAAGATQEKRVLGAADFRFDPIVGEDFRRPEPVKPGETPRVRN